ncbi:MAG: hypothetical protein HYV07_04100 [Deltaproteobacteria bacterium]|nr:hypothetical protein [Deltaproteobacteria bacterium]
MAQRGREILESLARSLTRRLLWAYGLVAVFMLFVGAIVGLRFVATQTTGFADDLDQLGESSSALAAAAAASYLDAQLVDRLTQVVQQTGVGIPGAQFAAITDQERRVVVSYPTGFVPKPHSGTTDEVWNGLEVRHFVTPIASTSMRGHRFHLGLDRAASGRRTEALKRSIISYASVAIGIEMIAVLIALLWIVSITKNMAQVAEGMKRSDDLVAEAASELHASAAQIQAVAKRTEDHATDEASAVDETRRTMQALLDAANEIADGARGVSEIAHESSKATEVTAERIATLNAQAVRIGDVSDMIQSIADKSELLALNAALEGARAGDAGRGFVLVAAEMRRLAESVMAAAREIKQLSSEIRELSQSAVLATEQGQKLSARNSDTARKITLITSQQSSATEEVTRSMDEIQEYTKQALTGAKEAKATASDLVRTAEGLTRALAGA